jgi:CubicO group peptidase (beta-lactamase class C family)
MLLPVIITSLISCNSNQKGNNTVSEKNIVTDVSVAVIDSALNQFVESKDIAGVSALVFEDGKEVYYNNFGYADIEDKVKMDRNTIVQIFSMTKPVTGVALMTLYEEGLFEMDDPLYTYLPEFKSQKVYGGIDDDGNLILEEPKRPITIRDITRHTAGFASNQNQEGVGPILAEQDPMNRENSLSEMGEKMAKVPLAFHPGEQWYYGPSVDVQALLVEKLSGKPFDQYVMETILEPLGMNETRYLIPEEDLNRFAASYRRTEPGNIEKVPEDQAFAFNTRDWSLKPGGWGLTSTIDDYMKFAQMLVNEGTYNDVQILKPETVKLMATNHLDEAMEERLWLPSKGQVGFGIDFAVRLREPADEGEKYGVVGEFFWDGAASTLFWVDPVNDLTAVLFVQLFPFDQIGLHKAFRAAVYGQ